LKTKVEAHTELWVAGGKLLEVFGVYDEALPGLRHRLGERPCHRVAVTTVAPLDRHPCHIPVFQHAFAWINSDHGKTVEVDNTPDNCGYLIENSVNIRLGTNNAADLDESLKLSFGE
jgi:hypothetical protein